MRIDRLEIENFKCFAKQTITLHPQFTLFVGENGSGKTSVLDALAVAAGIWLSRPPDTGLLWSDRKLLSSDVRIESEVRGDRSPFVQKLPTSVRAEGMIDDQNFQWKRTIMNLEQLPGLARSGVSDGVLAHILERFGMDAAGFRIVFPVLAYYGAQRACAGPPSQELGKENGPARRWAAFQGCLSRFIQLDQLQTWFRRETIERGNRGGRWRPGFEVVRGAVLRCLPGSDAMWFDSDRDEIVVSIDHKAQPLVNLSDGQRMLTALVADLAIKAVSQNSFLIPAEELGPDDEPLPRVLKETPGMVLIDELDLHLHPKWQRHVARDLKATFPKVQFVCTSHSPQIIGELKPEELRILDANGVASLPPRSFGLDSNRVLEEVMDAPTRDPAVEQSLRDLFRLIDREDFDAARGKIAAVEAELGPDDPEITRARALLAFLEAPI